MTLTLSVTDRVSEADVARIQAGLAASDPALGPYAPLPLAVLLHEPAEAGGAEGALVGGLIGHSVWQWLSIRLLWVDRRIVAPGTAGACWLRPSTLEDFPSGHQRLFYVKSLGARARSL